MPMGIVGRVITASAALFAVSRLQRALLRNERYRSTTWRWGKIVVGLVLPGWIMKLVATASLVHPCLGGGDAPQASTFKPCFSTTASSLSAMPLGRLVPASHFCTVDSLVFR